MLLATPSQTSPLVLCYEEQVFLQHSRRRHVSAAGETTREFLVAPRRVGGWDVCADDGRSLTAAVSSLALCKYQGIYACIVFSRCESAASLNPQGAARRGETVSLCLPARLDSLCLTLRTLLCMFWLPVLNRRGKVPRCFWGRYQVIGIIRGHPAHPFLRTQCTRSPRVLRGPLESTVWLSLTISGMSQWQFSKRLVPSSRSNDCSEFCSVTLIWK